MPTTRRRRANPPEQPEQGGPLIEATEQVNVPVEAQGTEHKQAEVTQAPLPEAKSPVTPATSTPAATTATGQGSVVEDTEAPQGQSSADEKTESVATPAAPAPSFRQATHAPRASHVSRTHPSFAAATPPATPVFAPEVADVPSSPVARPERRQLSERIQAQQTQQAQERPEYPPAIEGGRRTARGELFRRPPQPPQPPVATPAPVAVAQPQLQPPSHEITLPLGNMLHLAYNPGYTGSEEARSALLQKLASESKAGGRARCWSCGSLAIAYDRWATRSKSFGEVGIAFCEICGVWSVM